MPKAKMILHEPRIYKHLLKHKGASYEDVYAAFPLLPQHVVDHAIEGLMRGEWVYAANGRRLKLFAESPEDDEHHLIPGWGQYKSNGYHLLSGQMEIAYLVPQPILMEV